MAQIKKFQSGGSLILNGKNYTAEQINEYVNQAGLSSQERAALAGTINAIASGQSRTLDRNANSLSGDGVMDDFTNFYGSEKRAERNESGKSVRWANRQARRNSDFHIANTAINKLGGIEDYFTNKDAKAKAKAKEENVLYKLSDTDGFYNADGTFVEGPDNLNNKERIGRILNVLQNGGLDAYNLTQWGNDNTLSGLIGWYGQADADTKSKYTIDALWDRIKNKELTDLDKEILTKMGMGWGTPVATTPGMHKDWTGDKKAAEQAGVYFTKDKDNRWIINSNIASNQYLNSDWYGGGLDFLVGTDYENGFIGADGKLYTQAEILGGNVYRSDAINKFLSANKSDFSYKDWYDAVNGSVRFKGDRTSLGIGSDEYGLSSYNPYNAWNADWYDYFKNLGDGNEEYFLNDISSNYDGLNGKKVIAYVDPTGASDALGIKKLKYAVRDTNGQITSYDSESALINAGFTPKNQWWTPAPSVFNNSVWDIDDGKYAKAYTIMTKNQENTILVDRNGNYYIGRKKPGRDEWENPILIRNMPLFSAILENPSRYNNTQLEELSKNVPRSVIQSGINETVTPQNRQEVINQKIPKQYQTRGMWIDDNGVICAKGMFGSNQYWNEQDGKWSSKYPSMKIGGSIPKIKPLPAKFQYGGAVGKSKTEVKETTSEGAKTDITKSHKLNDEDGGLTSAEWWQIGAAIGDLTGIAMTFAPVYGNIAGAATGLLSSGAGLIGDIKKDGFQWSDLGSFGLSAAMDLGTLIPGAGTAAKVGKVTKALRAVAKPVMKLLTINGIVNGVGVMQKIVNGEDVTSDDLITLLRGISSTAVGAKMMKQQIGDAKLSKRIEDDVLKTQNAKIKTKPEATIEGKKIGGDDLDLTEINGKTKAEVETYLKGKVKAKLESEGIEFDEAKHGQDLSKKFGIEYDKGEYEGLKWKKIFRKGFIERGDAKANWTPNEEVEGSSFLNHFLNPFKRNSYLGYDYGFIKGKGHLDTVSARAYNKARQRVLSGKGSLFNRWANQSLLDRAYSNPNAFSFEFANDGVAYPGRVVGIGSEFWRKHVGKGKYAQSAIIPKQSIIPRNMDAEEALFRRRYIDSALENDVLGARYDMPLVPGEAGYVYPGRGRIPKWVVEFGFKNGGKIQYAKNGKKITKHQTTSTMPEVPSTLDYAKLMKDDLAFKGEYDSAKLLKKDSFRYNDQDVKLSDIDAAIGLNTGITGTGIIESGATDEESAKIIDRHGNAPSDKKPTNLKQTGAILSNVGKIVGEAALTANGINKQVGRAARVRDAVKSISNINNPEYYESFNDNGKKLAYDLAAQEAENQASYNVTSDSYRNRLFRKQAGAEARLNRLQGRLAQSQEYSDFRQRNLERKTAYAAQRVANLNEDIKRHAQADVAYQTELGKADALFTDMGKKAIGDLTGIYNKNKLAGLQSDLTLQARHYQDWYDSEKAKYDAGVKAGTINNTDYSTFDKYIAGNKSLLDEQRRWQDKITGIKTNAAMYQKKGGKMRSASEQIKIDTEKAKHKAIAQLSKQAFEILKMALK